MGPLTQILFVAIIQYFKIDVPSYFYTYHFYILFFNLLPIVPLDGGKLLQLLFCFFFSYYQSLQKSFYFSYFFFLILVFTSFQKNLILVLIFLLLGFKLLKEMNQGDYLFQKFLLERYLYNYSFSKIKIVKQIKEMKRENTHYFIVNHQWITEKEKLKEYFK